jgi:hypothetical protein
MNKILWEKKIIKLMVEIYCKNKHNSDSKLCEQCSQILHYASQRLDCCKFGNAKGTCRKCKIHCYTPDMKERIKEIMRFSGPRIIFYNPLAVIKHLFAGLKSAK